MEGFLCWSQRSSRHRRSPTAKDRQFENIWLRTQRYNAEGEVRSGTGGVCYVYFPAHPTAGQRRALRSVGIL